MRAQVPNILGFSWLTGPIFGKELRVSGRRRRNYVLRFVYLALLTVFLSMIWTAEVRSYSSLYTASRMGRAGQSIITFLIWFQFCATQLVAIVMLSTAIGDEINHRTLPALMTTPISGFQIVAGKLLSKLLQIMLLMAISLPLLAIVRVFGGVPWRFLVFSLALNLVCVLFVGLLSLLFSIFSRRAYVVMLANLLTLGLVFGLLPLLGGYLWLAVFGVGEAVFFKGLSAVNPYILLALETDRMMSPMSRGTPPSFGAGCFVSMLTACGVLFIVSAAMVRRVALLQATGQLGKRRARVITDQEQPQNQVVAVRCVSEGPLRRVIGPPVLWREMMRPVFGNHKRWYIGLIGAGFLLLAITYAMFAAERALDDEECHMLYACILLGLGTLFGIILPATAITSEKEAGTWPLLLLTTQSEVQILLAKGAGALRRVLPAFIFLIGHLMLFCMLGFINPIAIPQIGAIVTWVLLFLCGTGLYFSSRFKHTTTAVIMNFALAVSLWALIPLLLAMLTEITRGSDDLVEMYMNANPIFQAAVVMDATARGGWRLSQYHWLEFRMGVVASTIFLMNMTGVHVFAGLLFAWRAHRRLRQRIV